jgi:hypothetical protein
MFFENGFNRPFYRAAHSPASGGGRAISTAHAQYLSANKETYESKKRTPIAFFADEVHSHLYCCCCS